MTYQATQKMNLNAKQRLELARGRRGVGKFVGGEVVVLPFPQTDLQLGNVALELLIWTE
ncbi:MAG TPA: hypothetical protein VGO73_01950 [Pyrinomonadaceae bacterium]|jgi:hypothetical protein|nr:hypothetical protein [Pyrinomonadaceae bacterium]